MRQNDRVRVRSPGVNTPWFYGWQTGSVPHSDDVSYHNSFYVLKSGKFLDEFPISVMISVHSNLANMIIMLQDLSTSG